MYDWDPETGDITNRQPFFDNHKRRPASLQDPLSAMLGPGFPDGHILDTHGNVWQAVYGRSLVERFTPAGEGQGKNDLQIQVPARCPTCPVFGGQNLDQLYVTTASQELKPGEAELLKDQGGSILRIDLSKVLNGAKGTVKHSFGG